MVAQASKLRIAVLEESQSELDAEYEQSLRKLGPALECDDCNQQNLKESQEGIFVEGSLEERYLDLIHLNVRF